MSTTRLLVSDHESMALPPSILRRIGVDRGLSAAGGACPPPPLVVTSQRDHGAGDRLEPGRLVASWLPARTTALAKIDADDLTGRRLHARHLIPCQLRPHTLAVRQRQLDSVLEPERHYPLDGGRQTARSAEL